jgi:tRNA threonylcarbamoyladenosine biosynthesis protein TsaB
MNLLAIDTSSVACSVALQSDESIIERHEEQAREHTRLLMPMLGDVLAESGITAQDLDAIVLGNGPGSFIGMRIAASVAQGLAHGAGIGIAPVSSLAAVAVEVFRQDEVDEVIVAQDAHMNEVYLGGYERGEGGLPAPLFPERLQAQLPVAELDAANADRRCAAGFGWQRYPALLAANEDLIGNRSEVLYPRARYLLPLGEFALRNEGVVAPQDLSPAYLRSKVAEAPGTRQP